MRAALIVDVNPPEWPKALDDPPEIVATNTVQNLEHPRTTSRLS